jgi:hypothetical protein
MCLNINDLEFGIYVKFFVIKNIAEVVCVRCLQDDKLYAIQNPFNPFVPRAKKKTYMTYMFKKHCRSSWREILSG